MDEQEARHELLGVAPAEFVAERERLAKALVLAGNPAQILDGRGYRLSPGACGLIPVGMKHAWLGPTSGRTLDASGSVTLRAMTLL